MGDATQKFFRAEMEKTWGAKHLSVFSEEEAGKWVMGVSGSCYLPIYLPTESDLVVMS